MKTYFFINLPIEQFWSMHEAQDIEHAIVLFCNYHGYPKQYFIQSEWKIIEQSKVFGWDAIEIMKTLISTGNYEARSRWSLRTLQNGCEPNKMISLKDAEKIPDESKNLVYLAENFVKIVNNRIYKYFTVHSDWQCEFLAEAL